MPIDRRNSEGRVQRCHISLQGPFSFSGCHRSSFCIVLTFALKPRAAVRCVMALPVCSNKGKATLHKGPRTAVTGLQSRPPAPRRSGSGPGPPLRALAVADQLSQDCTAPTPVRVFIDVLDACSPTRRLSSHLRKRIQCCRAGD